MVTVPNTRPYPSSTYFSNALRTSKAFLKASFAKPLQFANRETAGVAGTAAKPAPFGHVSRLGSSTALHADKPCRTFVVVTFTSLSPAGFDPTAVR